LNRSTIWAMFSKTVSEINRRLMQLPGFELYTQEDINQFFENPKNCSLGFKKKEGQGILYGLELAGLRRQIFNTLPLEKRLTILRQKVRYYILDRFIESFLDFQVSLQHNLVDVTDIGMGHTVFKLTFSKGSQVVLKQSQHAFEPFYMAVLSLLGLPNFNAQCIQSKQQTWMLSDYIVSKNLTDYLSVHDMDENFVKKLAKQAAIGDCLGRGDRHFENYIISGVGPNARIYPIDISHLFWPDNEAWVQRYIEGGQSEFCIISLDNMSYFWDTYERMWQNLVDQQDKLIDLIKSFFSHDNADAYESFVTERLNDTTYLSKQFERVEKSRFVFRDRQELKRKLDYLVQTNPSILDKNQYLAMYYHSNHGRMTSFFLIDYFKREILLEKIKSL
jgi:hypothetical protein